MQYGVVALFLALFLVAGWRARRPLAIRGSDELIYVGLSHSLEHGEYRDNFLVGSPPHTKYPPAYPLWLIPVRHLTGESVDGIELFNLVLAAGALLLLYGVARRLLGSALAGALLFLLATTPVLLDWSSSVMSESLFLILSTGSLVAAFTADRKGGSAGPAMIGAWLAFLTRTAGLALIGALGVWLLRRRRPTELWTFAIGSAVVVGGWFGYTWLAPGGLLGLSYENDLAAIGSTQGGGGGALGALVSLVTQASRTALYYATQTLPVSLALPTLRGTIVDNLVWQGVTAVLLGVGGFALRRTWRPAVWYLVFYGAMVVVWPWSYNRLLVPILPLLFFTLLFGADVLTRKLPLPARRLTLGVLVGLLGLGTIKGSLERDASRRSCDRSDPLHSAGCHSPEIRSLIAGIEYIGSRAGPQDVVLTSEPVTVNYLTGRPTVPSRVVVDLAPGRAAAWLRQLEVRFALLSSVRPGDRGPVAQALLASCRELQVAERLDPHTLVLIPTPPEEGSPDACAVLSRFLEDMKGYGDPDP